MRADRAPKCQSMIKIDLHFCILKYFSHLLNFCFSKNINIFLLRWVPEAIFSTSTMCLPISKVVVSLHPVWRGSAALIVCRAENTLKLESTTRLEILRIERDVAKVE